MVVNGERLLITGCSGFIGRALAVGCASAGYRVGGVVRNHARASDLPPEVEPVVVPDAGPQADWSDALAGVKAVVHLAGHVHQDHLGAGAEHYRVNLAGTAVLARAAAEAGVRRLLFLSTIKVHGEGKEGPYAESHPCQPHDDYAISKCEAEKVLRAISANGALQTTILRPPLVYGPGVKANFLRLIRLVEHGVLFPFGSIDNRRSLIYVGNLVDAILTALRHPNATGNTFLVADPEPVSTPELIREIAAQLGIPSRLMRFPVSFLKLAGRLVGRSAQVERLTGSLWADTREIQARLGWRPRVSFDQGLAETVAWYRNRTSAEHAHD